MNVPECVASRPHNIAFHNCYNSISYKQAPSAYCLIDLHLNYFIKAKALTMKEMANKTTYSLWPDMRRKYAIKECSPEEGGYISKLYIKSDYRFDPESKEI